MIVRLIVGTLACALLASFAMGLAGLAPQTAQRASNMQGERWYKLTLDDRHVGYLHSRTWRDRAGNWQFATDLRFVLAPGEPVAILDNLTFAHRAPFTLISARHEDRRRGELQQVSVTRSAAGYTALIHTDGEVDTRHEARLEWEYSLEDYLAFENWLHKAHPRIGATMTVPTLDLERLSVIKKNHRVIDRNPIGYAVENPAVQYPTRIQLDANYTPVSLEMAGLFSLTRTTEAAALAPRTALQSGSYFIPTDQAIKDHHNVERLVLKVMGPEAITGIWPQLNAHDDGWTMTLHANPLTDSYGADYTGETTEFPSSSLRVARLARQAVEGADTTAEQVSLLTRFVHEYLRYRPGASQRSVLALLDRPVGDCTEFADLFTTLARALNIPARTIFGLAYAERPSPAFAFHAWNEVEVDGAWQAVDPTWNQVRVDATHIPLPTNSATLRLITGVPDLRFSVSEVDYFSR